MAFAAVERRGSGAIKWDEMAPRFGRDDLTALWVADMDVAVPEEVHRALTHRAAHPVYGYTRYDEAFFDAIIWWYHTRFGWSIDREWIVPDHGVVLSINTAIAALTRSGEGVLIQTPIYPPFMEAVHRNERTLLENRLIHDGERYRIDWDDFEAKAAEASLFLLCSPHNPTTRAWDQDELERMAQICQQHNVVIVADEIHSDIVYDRPHLPIGMLETARKHTLTLHAPSKTFNIAGLNTSFAIIPDPQIRSAYRRIYDRLGLPHGNPFGIEALKAAYTPEGEAWLDALKVHLQNNISLVRQFLAERIPRIVPVPTEATFLIWLDCRQLQLTEEQLQRLFIEEARLALNPGTHFGPAGSGYMRLNIGTTPDVLRAALEQLARATERAGV